MFSTGENNEVLKSITELLWGNSHEVYADDKYDEDEILVYYPPPLHKVWLDKDDGRESRNILCQQRDQNIDRENDVERKIVHQVPEEATPTSNFENIPNLISKSDDSSGVSSTDSITLGVVQE